MVTKCIQCGKRIDITWPSLWAYKRWQGYLCTWSCLREYDKKDKGENNVDKRVRLKPEEVNKVIEIVKNGESPFVYMRSIGIKYPQTCWYKIKERIMDKNPELYAQLPKKLPNEQKPQVDKGMPKKLELEGGQDYQLKVAETPEKPKTEIVMDDEHIEIRRKITKPVNYGGYDVTAIRDPDLGEFYHDTKFNVIDWRTPDGEEVSLNPTGWKNLARQLPEILRILGVDA